MYQTRLPHRFRQKTPNAFRSLKMFFIRRVLCLFILIMTVGSAASQLRPQAPTLLVALTEKSEDPWEVIDNLGLRVRSELISEKSFLAIRICSTDPLPVAVATARGLPFVAAELFSRIGIPKSSIVYLREDGVCAPTFKGSRTEYWLVPRNAEFPSFVELQYATGLSFEVLAERDLYRGNRQATIDRSAWQQLNEKSYQSVLNDLMSKLVENRNCSAVIAFFNDRRTRDINERKKIAAIRAMLTSNGIGIHRIHFKSIESFYKQEYPAITLIKPL
jgi:hypothetical protein